ncbi:MAG: VWA domain-containing protein [Myxococcales bacterium]|nr:VWA domain-containing protein [Myxococcales bacterium]
MRFGAPWALFFLLLVPAILLAHWFYHRWRQLRMARAGDPFLLEALTSGWQQHQQTRNLQTLLLATTFAFACIALARPQLGMRPLVRQARGMDVVIALDLSRSMYARDVVPSRLKRAKVELGVLIEQLRGDRVGLVGFTTIGLPLCPLTIDHAALRIQLSGAEPGDLPRGGTSVAAAIRAAAQMLEAAGHPKADKAIVVLTDGETHLGDPVQAATEASQQGIVVHVAGVGSMVGEPIPIVDETGTVSGYIKDKQGNTVVSRLDDNTLKAIASAGNGLVALPSGTGGLDLGTIAQHLASLRKAEQEERTVHVFEERFIWVLVPAFLLLLLATLIRPTRPAGLPRIALCLALAGAGGGLGAPKAFAQELLKRNHPKVEEGAKALQNGQADVAKEAFRAAQEAIGDHPVLTYNQALADAAQEELTEAISGFRAAAAQAEDPNLRAKASLGLGNALRKLKKYDEAAAAYQEALLDDPALSGARRNLELTQFMKAVQAAQPPSENEGDNESSEDNDQKDPQDSENEENKENQEEDSSQQNEDPSDEDGEQDPSEEEQEQDREEDEPEKDGEEAPSEEEPEQDQNESEEGDQDPPEEEDSGSTDNQAENGANESSDEEQDLSRQEAEAILDALQAEEKALERKRLLKRFKGRPVEKDW